MGNWSNNSFIHIPNLPLMKIKIGITGLLIAIMWLFLLNSAFAQNDYERGDPNAGLQWPPGSVQVPTYEWEWAWAAEDTSGQPTDNQLWWAKEPTCPKGSITLNTYIPFVWRCIDKWINADPSKTTIVNVFPKLTWNLMRLTMTIVMVMGFLGILVGWFMIASNGALGTKQQWIKIITMIIAWFILLGATWVILNLVNPAFFGTDS